MTTRKIDTDGWALIVPKKGDPYAIHTDTGRVMRLEYRLHDDKDAPDMDPCWIGMTRYQAAELEALLETGRLRVRGAIHGVPGASALGALFC